MSNIYSSVPTQFFFLAQLLVFFFFYAPDLRLEPSFACLRVQKKSSAVLKTFVIFFFFFFGICRASYGYHVQVHCFFFVLFFVPMSGVFGVFCVLKGREREAFQRSVQDARRFERRSVSQCRQRCHKRLQGYRLRTGEAVSLLPILV